MDERVTIEVASTLDDQVRFNEFLLAQPEVRRRTAWRVATVPWVGVRSLDETTEQLVVGTGLFSGYVFPKGEITAVDLATICAIAASRVGRPAAANPWGIRRP